MVSDFSGLFPGFTSVRDGKFERKLEPACCVTVKGVRYMSRITVGEITIYHITKDL